MSMKITQEYMDEEVIKPINELKEKIDLALSNTKHLVEQFDKVIKLSKKK